MGLAPNRRQAITRTNADQEHNMTSPGHSEFNGRLCYHFGQHLTYSNSQVKSSSVLIALRPRVSTSLAMQMIITNLSTQQYTEANNQHSVC